jgi:tripartite-type tricarboxylate transporter receptor subunit TctC
MKLRKAWIVGVIALLVLALTAGCGGNKKEKAGEDWPKGKLTLLVPFKAGGSVDSMARALAKYWEKELGLPLIIDNRDGASGQVGATVFQKMPVDGNTIFLGTQTYLSANIVLQNAKFNIDDFDVINFQQVDPVTIAVLEDSPYQTLDDLIQDIKKNPNKVKWGTIFGGPLQLAGEILHDKLGLQVKTISYDSGSAMRTALLGKHVDYIIGNANGDQAIKGKARVLAVADTKRNSIWPDSPILNDALKKYNVSIPTIGSSRFIAVHKGLKAKYPERYSKLVETYKKAYESSDYQAFRKQTGEDTVSNYYGPAESQKMNHEIHQLIVQYKDKLKR